MKMKVFKYIIPAVALFWAAFITSSCTSDLDVENINPQQVSDPNYDYVLNKIYANLTLTGQTGPDGNCDMSDVDEGMSQFVRQMWNANELTTDESHCSWGDAGIPEYNHNAWTDTHEMLRPLYYRVYFGITCANFYLDNATDGDDISIKRAEARFLRAYYYYVLLDMWGNVPFVTTVTSELPVQIQRADLYDWIISELKDINGENSSDEVLADVAPAYGRVSKAAANMLLARLYLNAEVYTGTAQWDNALTYAKKVIDSGYSLCTTGLNGYSAFQLLFMGDNDSNGAEDEIILPAIQDGVTTQTWGGTLFIIASTTNSDITGEYPSGTTEGWGGNRARKQFVEKFFPNDDIPEGTPTEVTTAAGDDRALFYSKGRTVSIEEETSFASGEAYVKFLNLHADGTTTHSSQYTDTDFPIMRLAEAYLTYAEADARLNGGTCTSTGLAYVNALRSRASATTKSSMTTAEILDEWSREFAYEGRRRIDLIRYGYFGGQNSYKWEWMGGSQSGTPFAATRNIFAIPTTDLNANSNLVQNPGY